MMNNYRETTQFLFNWRSKNPGHSEIDQGVLHSTIAPFCAVRSDLVGFSNYEILSGAPLQSIYFQYNLSNILKLSNPIRLDNSKIASVISVCNYSSP